MHTSNFITVVKKVFLMIFNLLFHASLFAMLFLVSMPLSNSSLWHSHETILQDYQCQENISARQSTYYCRRFNLLKTQLWFMLHQGSISSLLVILKFGFRITTKSWNHVSSLLVIANGSWKNDCMNIVTTITSLQMVKDCFLVTTAALESISFKTIFQFSLSLFIYHQYTRF